MYSKVIEFRRPMTVAVNKKNEVVYVGWGEPPAGMVDNIDLLLAGEVGETVYMALAGHRYEAEPETASWETAMEARRELAFMLDEAETARKRFYLGRAMAVVAAFGEKLQPWLGVTMLDGGTPVMDALEYRITLAPRLFLMQA